MSETKFSSRDCLETMTVAELRQLCRDRELKGHSRHLRKADLIAFILESISPIETNSDPTPDPGAGVAPDREIDRDPDDAIECDRDPGDAIASGGDRSSRSQKSGTCDVDLCRGYSRFRETPRIHQFLSCRLCPVYEPFMTRLSAVYTRQINGRYPGDEAVVRRISAGHIPLGRSPPKFDFRALKFPLPVLSFFLVLAMDNDIEIKIDFDPKQLQRAVLERVKTDVLVAKIIAIELLCGALAETTQTQKEAVLHHAMTAALDYVDRITSREKREILDRHYGVEK